MSKQTPTLTLLLLIVAFSLSACNFPGAGAAPAATAVTGDAGEAPSAIPVLEASATPAPDPTATPEPPPGFIEVPLGDWPLAFYAPEGWVAHSVEGGRFDLVSPDDSAWIELVWLDDTSAQSLGIRLASDSASAQVQTLGLRYAEDGDLGEVEVLPLMFGGEGALNVVEDTAFQERLLLAVLHLDPVTVLAIAHERSAEDWEALQPLYREVLSTVHLTSR